MKQPEFAVYYEPEAFSFATKIMGRQSAGAGFVRAIANLGLERVWCYAASQASAEDFAERLTAAGAAGVGVGWIPVQRPDLLGEPGLLYRPDPRFGEDAWRRRACGKAAAYSICGITHTVSSHAVMDSIAQLMHAPLEPWDALICTSNAGRAAVQSVLQDAADDMRERFGAQRFPQPELPVIPLGVHAADFAFSEAAKEAARTLLGIAPDEVAVLFAGRLVVHAKAHPLPMYLALEQAAAGHKVVLIQAGIAPNKPIEDLYRGEARQFCPSVRVMLVDGKDERRYRAAWGAADIFTSLADSIQETFGLTPVEAMAAGLPSVVSDWDGYKDTVRDAIDGYRVPTLSMPAGTGGDLADRYDLGFDSYDLYVGNAAQLVAVDIEAATVAYRRLIADRSLRLQMGSAARRRARETFDWSVIFARYRELWHSLGERRRQASPGVSRARRRPERADPFSMFAAYPSHGIGPTTEFRRRASVTLQAALDRRGLASTRFAKVVLPSAELVALLYAGVPEDRWRAYAELAEVGGDFGEVATSRALVWLTKMGVFAYRLGSGALPEPRAP